MRSLSLFLIAVTFFIGCSSITGEKGKIVNPEYNRFSSKVLVEGLEEPIQLEFDEAGHIYWIERTGGVKRLHESTGTVVEMGVLRVHKDPGLIGILLDKNFGKTRHVFLYYSAAEDSGDIVRLSRFTLGPDDELDTESEVVVLRVPWQQPSGAHMGGGMTWDANGNLYLSVGGDTAPTKYAPLKFTNENGRGQDASRTAANTNDFRGKILRIHIEPDGSYTIPEGNLFPPGTPGTRPEIYVMGNRNPWRLSIDSKTGFLHWGEVGPDAGMDSTGIGPMGYDEFNVAKQAGNFGWPFFIGYNRSYNRYDYEKGKYVEKLDVLAPVNESPNNTGLSVLPPAMPALIAYPYGVSDEWPLLNSGARSAVGGPIFRRSDFSNDAPRVFPLYYEGKWFITDYVRNWIMVVAMNEDRTKVMSIEPFLPARQLTHRQPLDMDFGPSGDLYLVEYGVGSAGRISKIVYNSGNRPPIAKAGADKTAGSLPLMVQLTADATVDYDGDNLTYVWKVFGPEGDRQLKGKDPVVTFSKPGKYSIELTVNDPAGETGRDSLHIVAGNERPDVNLEIIRGNGSFYFPGSSVGYKVQVSDLEDGNLDSGIDEQEVIITAEYVSAAISIDQVSEMLSKDQLSPGISIQQVQAQKLIIENNCNTCHRIDSPLVGPSFKAVAERSEETGRSVDSLVQKIIEGGSGVWGNVPMPPQSTVPRNEARQIVEFILSLSDSDSILRELNVEGTFNTSGNEAIEQNGRLDGFYDIQYERGMYVLRASYADNGISQFDETALEGDDFIILQHPLLAPEEADIISEGITYTPSTNDPGFIINGQGGHIGFENTDLTGINTIEVGAITRFWHWSHFIGGTVEIRLDSPTGPIVGEPYDRKAPSTGSNDGPFFGDDLEKPIPVDVSAISGIHDVFIVVHNPNAKKDDALLIMTGIEFKQ